MTPSPDSPPTRMTMSWTLLTSRVPALELAKTYDTPKRGRGATLARLKRNRGLADAPRLLARQAAAQVQPHPAVPPPALEPQDDVAAGCKARLDGEEGPAGAHGLLVELEDDVAREHAELVGETAGLDVGDDESVLVPLQPVLGRLRGRELLQGHPERGAGLGRLLGRGLFAELLGEHLVAVFNDDGGLLGFLVAQVADFGGLAHGQGGDFADQVVAGADGTAGHFGDDVAAPQPGLLRRAAGLDALDHHAVVGAEAAQDGFILAHAAAEADADGAAHHAAVLDDFVVDLDGDVRRQGEADPRRAAPAVSHDGGIDPDDLPGQVHQRPARVAVVDGGVGLE